MTNQAKDRIIDDVRTFGEYLNDNPDAVNDELAEKLRAILIPFWNANDRRAKVDRRAR